MGGLEEFRWAWWNRVLGPGNHPLGASMFAMEGGGGFRE